jgi:hypothetical protein
LANRLTEFLAEARRRRVFQTAGVYLVAVWGISSGSVDVAPLFGASEWMIRASMIAAIAFLPVVLLLAWRFDIGRSGIVRDPHDVAAQRALDDDLADMPTMLGGDAGQGAVIVRWTDTQGSNASIFADEFHLGRGSDCRVRFYDPLVSRDHARVYCEDGVWKISDLGSRNGTIVNGAKVRQQALAEENEVRLNEAGPVLRLEVVPPGEPTRSAMTRMKSGSPVAHVRSPSLDIDPARGSRAWPKRGG